MEEKILKIIKGTVFTDEFKAEQIRKLIISEIEGKNIEEIYELFKMYYAK